MQGRSLQFVERRKGFAEQIGQRALSAVRIEYIIRQPDRPHGDHRNQAKRGFARLVGPALAQCLQKRSFLLDIACLLSSLDKRVRAHQPIDLDHVIGRDRAADFDDGIANRVERARLWLRCAYGGGENGAPHVSVRLIPCSFYDEKGISSRGRVGGSGG